MWEAIRKNRRRSWILITVMGLTLLVLGHVIGSALFLNADAIGNLASGARGSAHPATRTGDTNDNVGSGLHPLAWLSEPSFWFNSGGLIGMSIAAGIWTILTLVALFAGDAMLLRSAGAHEIAKQDAPRLWNTVEEMTIASGLGGVPRVFIVDDDAPNAFAVGRTPEKAAVAVTAGLLRRLDRDELQGVIAHEIGHIRNHDIRFLTLASVMVGSIVLISEIFLRSLWYGAGRRSSSSRSGGKARLVLMVIAILFAILAPVVARLLYLACSRRREYLADASAARFTRFPDGLASALEKIGGRRNRKEKTRRSLAPLYIVNPLQSMSAAGLFSTHPPLEKRVAILRAMAGGAGYVDYEDAYKKIYGAASACLDPGCLKSESHLAARKPSPETKPKTDAVERAREVMDVLDRAANFLLLTCPCGMRIKLPPGFKQDQLNCPRCSRTHRVPRAAEKVERPSSARAGPLTYRRHTTGWESFRCTCGHTLQISPNFSGSRISCRKCSRHIKMLA